MEQPTNAKEYDVGEGMRWLPLVCVWGGLNFIWVDTYNTFLKNKNRYVKYLIKIK
jgi:hypothetical protein